MSDLNTMLTKWRTFSYRTRMRTRWIWRSISPPWRRRTLDIWSVAGGLGDELMVLGVLQLVVDKAIHCTITYHARHTNLLPASTDRLKILPYIKESLPARSIGLTYLAKHRLPIIAQMARQLGLRTTEYEIALSPRKEEELPPLFPREGQVVVIQTVASDWTPNKQWPEEHWREMVELLPPDVAVVEVGKATIFKCPPNHPRFISYVGKTSVVQFAACIQECSVFVGPPSGGVHLAHGYKVPSVVIIGGYENSYPYPLATQFYTSLECSPCWLRTPCPYDRKCLRLISPAKVCDGVVKALEPSKASAPLTLG